MNLPKKLLSPELLEEELEIYRNWTLFCTAVFGSDENRFCFGLAVGKYGTGYIRVKQWKFTVAKQNRELNSADNLCRQSAAF